MSRPPSVEEVMIGCLSLLVAQDRHVAVGAASPIPAAAALLAQAEARHSMAVSLLESPRENRFTDGGRELFDCAGRGRIDSFFLSGVEIDGSANINLVGPGDYPATRRRFAGSFGSAYMYFVVPRTILVREEHSRRTLVERVDFISAPGTSPPGVFRRGGPVALVTGLCHFTFEAARGRFRLESLHPGVSLEEVRDRTGFAFDLPEPVATTPLPGPDRLGRLRREIAPRLAALHPAFAARVFSQELEENAER